MSMSLNFFFNDKLIVIPPEMVLKILSNLDPVDLLKFRQVSPIWSQECLKLIKKRTKKKNESSKIERSLKLTHTNIKDFLDFVTQDPLEIVGLFQWTIQELDLTVECANSPEQLAKLESNVISLKALLGPKCIKSLTVTATTTTTKTATGGRGGGKNGGRTPTTSTPTQTRTHEQLSDELQPKLVRLLRLVKSDDWRCHYMTKILQTPAPLVIAESESTDTAENEDSSKKLQFEPVRFLLFSPRLEKHVCCHFIWC